MGHQEEAHDQLYLATKQGERSKLKRADRLCACGKYWETLLPGHASTLTGLMNGLEADVVRVPLIRGPKATKEILSSAIDIMNGVDMELLQKRQIADSVLSELAKTIVLEKVCLIECGDLLAATLLQWRWKNVV
ncbi:hypothetical protein GOP47_0013972 [Adiantum capillus-veneris]|uniref:Uncharacterized protein n=1 Tax=Adiantum capillus-veneris TaxID=13818 RepID=A0A9D4UPR9_ADICA|nr:hypothetical protein GOP47_0013972 [Adiantum capillus-veneris]